MQHGGHITKDLLGPRGVPVGGGGGYPDGYANKLLQIETASLVGYWRLNESDGLVATDSAADLDGTAANITWGAEGIGDYSTSASFNGSNTRVVLPHAGIDAAFNKHEGTVSCWVYIPSAAWTDDAVRFVFQLRADANNSLNIQKFSYNNRLLMIYKNGGTELEISKIFDSTPADWLHLAFTWSELANEVKGFVNGTQVDSTKTLDTWNWSGALALAVIGAFSDSTTYPFSGSIAHAALWSKALTSSQIGVLASPDASFF